MSYYKDLIRQNEIAKQQAEERQRLVYQAEQAARHAQREATYAGIVQYVEPIAKQLADDFLEELVRRKKTVTEPSVEEKKITRLLDSVYTSQVIQCSQRTIAARLTAPTNAESVFA